MIDLDSYFVKIQAVMPTAWTHFELGMVGDHKWMLLRGFRFVSLVNSMSVVHCLLVGDHP